MVARKKYPDASRGANLLLRMAVQGQVVMSFTPPGFLVSDWSENDEVITLKKMAQVDHSARRVAQFKSDVSSRAETETTQQSLAIWRHLSFHGLTFCSVPSAKLGLSIYRICQKDRSFVQISRKLLQFWPEGRKTPKALYGVPYIGSRLYLCSFIWTYQCINDVILPNSVRRAVVMMNSLLLTVLPC